MSKEIELVDCKSQDPGDVDWSNGEGVVALGNEGHVVMVIYQSW